MSWLELDLNIVRSSFLILSFVKPVFPPSAKAPSAHPFSHLLTPVLPNTLLLCLVPLLMVNRLSCVLLNLFPEYAFHLRDLVQLSPLQLFVEDTAHFLTHPTVREPDTVVFPTPSTVTVVVLYNNNYRERYLFFRYSSIIASTFALPSCFYSLLTE